MEDQSYYRKYRPKTLQGVVGQEGAVASLQSLLSKKKLPHVFLFTGPSGTGKTTIARIIKTELDCGDHDFFEINCADFKGIEMVRDIRRSVSLSPISGSSKVWLIDEAHKLTNDAQNALLKLLEDTPKHVYFMLATTDPQKLIKTIHGRCAEVKLAGMSAKALQRVIQRVIDKEKLKVSEAVIDEIVEAADSSARKALVILEQIGSLLGDKEQIAAIQTTTFNKDKAIELARKLLFGAREPWPVFAGILVSIKDEDAEGIRYCILGYARAILVGSEGKPPNPKFTAKAFKVIDIFSKNFYDGKHAALAAACYEVLHC